MLKARRRAAGSAPPRRRERARPARSTPDDRNVGQRAREQHRLVAVAGCVWLVAIHDARGVAAVPAVAARQDAGLVPEVAQRRREPSHHRRLARTARRERADRHHRPLDATRRPEREVPRQRGRPSAEAVECCRGRARSVRRVVPVPRHSAQPAHVVHRVAHRSRPRSRKNSTVAIPAPLRAASVARAARPALGGRGVGQG